MLDVLPFKLELGISRDLQLKVSLKNISKSTQLVFIHAYHQPCYLAFRDDIGTVLPPGAPRMLPGFNPQPLQRESFQEVPLKGRILFGDTQFRLSGRKYLVVWHLNQHELKPGNYRVEATWASRLNTYVDGNGERRTLPGVWLGNVRSNEVKLQLREI